MKEEVEKNFLDKILSTLSRFNTNMLVSLNIGSHTQHKEIVKEIPSGFKTNLSKEMTFDTFVEGKSNQLAKAACLSVINEPGIFNPLYIYGGVGMGKTHLLNSIGISLKSKHKVMFISAERFMYHFIKSIKKNDMVNFKDFFRKSSVFIIDSASLIDDNKSL